MRGNQSRGQVFPRSTRTKRICFSCLAEIHVRPRCRRKKPKLQELLGEIWTRQAILVHRGSWRLVWAVGSKYGKIESRERRPLTSLYESRRRRPGRRPRVVGMLIPTGFPVSFCIRGQGQTDDHERFRKERKCSGLDLGNLLVVSLLYQAMSKSIAPCTNTSARFYTQKTYIAKEQWKDECLTIPRTPLKGGVPKRPPTEEWTASTNLYLS